MEKFANEIEQSEKKQKMFRDNNLYSQSGYATVMLAVISAMIFLLTGSAAAQTVSLSGNGSAEVVIVIPEKPAPTEKFAAEELKYYLDKITGGSSSIATRKSDSGYSIILGDTAYAREAGIDISKLKRDEFIIDVKGKSIFIAGKDEKGEKAGIIFSLKENPGVDDLSPRAGEIHFASPKWDFDKATLFGVYYFLEQLGVRWFFPGPEGEVIARNPKLEFNVETRRHCPDYKLRFMGTAFWPANLCQNQMSQDEFKALGWTAKRNCLWVLRMGGTGKWMAFNHSYNRTRWKERFAAQHPEYFALLKDGKRDLPAKLEDSRYRYHLCFTNPDVFKENIKDIDAFFSGQPAAARGIPSKSTLRYTQGWYPEAAYGDTFSLNPHDSFKPCRCKECAKLLHDELDYSALSSDLIWSFVRKTALEVQKKWPGKYVTCLAYSSYTQPPVSFKKLPDNVIIGLCPQPSLNKTYNSVDEKNYKKLMDLALQWSKYNKQPLIVWFHHLYRHKQPAHNDVPMHIPHHLGRLLKDMSKYAEFGFIELDCDSVFYDHVDRYVMQKLLWDVNLDVDKLIDDYLRKYYGDKAFGVMKEFYADLEEKCTKIAANQAGRQAIYEAYFNRKCIARYEALIKKALELTRGTEYNQHVQYVAKYLVDGIKRGHDEFTAKFSSAKTNSTVPVYFISGPITIDGQINEDAWKESEVLDLVNNVDSQKTAWKTDVRLLWDKENIYFAFDCYSPNIAQNLKDKQYDSIEIFLDSNYDKDSYHQILIDNNGKVQDFFFEGGGEMGNSSWRSGLKKAIKINRDGWVVEAAIPIKNLNGSGVIKEGVPWGMNVCRTIANPPNEKDRFNTFSRLILGRFDAQADLFAKMYFFKDAKQKTPGKNE